MKENHNNYKDRVKVKDRLVKVITQTCSVVFLWCVTAPQTYAGHCQSCLLDCLSPCLSLFLEIQSPQLHEEITYRQSLRLYIKHKVAFDPLLG